MFQIIFSIFIVIVVGIILGFKFAIHIYNPVLYILFWVMYFITFLSVMSLLGNVYIYDTISNKNGIPGQKGLKGETGETGEIGICKGNCRDDFCYHELLKHCNDYLNKTHPNPGKPIEIHNKYWKDRLSKICRSREFSNLVTHRGRDDIVKYVIKILNIWMDLLYKEGGRLFFESMGSENEFEWRTNNPWNEIKKYDMYYWDMHAIFRIRQFSNCNKPLRDMTKPEMDIIDSNEYYSIWDNRTNRGQRKLNNSFWHPKTIHKNNTKYYPMGDVYFPLNNNDKRDKTITRGDINIEYKSKYIDYKFKSGPSQVTQLVNGNSNVKAPIGFKYIGSSYYYYCSGWWCEKYYWNKSRRPRYVHIFEIIPPNGYIAMGCAAKSSSMNNPNQIIRYINKDDYRCISKKCVERVGNGSSIVFQHGSFKIYQPHGHHIRNSGYLFKASHKNHHKNDSLYRIKNSCTDTTNDTPRKDYKYSNKWYEQPAKDRKYSILHYLSLPSTAILVNKGNPRIFMKVRHVSGKSYNSYHIIQYSSGVEIDDQNESLLEAVDNNDLKWRQNTIPKVDSYQWVINMDQTKYGDMTITSKAHNQYLRYVSNTDKTLVHPNRADKYTHWQIKK
jgi:hypothetical protein